MNDSYKFLYYEVLCENAPDNITCYTYNDFQSANDFYEETKLNSAFRSVALSGVIKNSNYKD